ncbi:MAG: hypothetical protein EP297_09015 [Gammaproteobacteria bacterium]|nr:MAG: hypothetical protein EP297_09015 [Gammaproteobacteria bacterium]
MQLPSSNPESITALFKQVLDDRKKSPSDKASDEITTSVMHFLTIIKQNQEHNHVLAKSNVTEIGDFVLQILQRIIKESGGMTPELANPLTISIALWIAENHGEISMLEPVVDALSRMANQTQEHSELAALSRIASEIIDACEISIKNDLDNANPGRPWRVLNINHGIMATRSHNPDIMEEAFQSLIKRLPQDAPGFFKEGMSEMDRLGYPEHVREVMQRYNDQWNKPKTLH